LNKPGALSEEEWQVMKQHPLIGYKICLPLKKTLGMAIDMILHHHEKLDGSGYPLGTTRISFGGQVIGIVDCYEALTNEERPYRRARDPMDTLKLLKGDVEAGKFSRRIFEKFCYSLI
jgi:HD-GYP domain-containing protein (c-di-GMP phosphodiesterase class II)